MTEVIYTREITPESCNDSSLVDEVYYNDNNGDLYVGLHNTVYKYSKVPCEVANKFNTADSAGTFYNTKIKGQYQSEIVGRWPTLTYTEVDVVVSGPGTPSVVVNVTGPTTAFSLKPFEDPRKVEDVERDYAIIFEVDGLNGFRTHRLKSNSVDEAVQAVLDLGKMLELTFIVREVIITFA